MRIARQLLHKVGSAERVIQRHVNIEFVRDFKHSHHILLIGMHLERDLMFHDRNAVFHRLVIRRHLLRIARRIRLFLHIYLDLGQVIAERLRNAHSGHRAAVLSVVNALGIDAHRRFERNRIGDGLLCQPLARRLDGNAVTADHVAASRNDAVRRNAVFAGNLEPDVVRVDGVVCVQLSRHGVGQLVDIAPTLAVFRKVAAMRMRVDHARHDDFALHIQHFAVLFRQINANLHDFSAVNQHIALLDDALIRHRQNGSVFQQ